MYFTNCKTVAEVKSEYRRLAKANHPDRGGDTRVMQDINAAYHNALANLNGETVRGTDGRDHVYRYERDIEQAIMDKIAELLALNMSGVEIELIGWWVWVHGDTRPVKELLKGAGCLWHSKRQMWYWRQVKSRYSNKGFDSLRAAYGSQRFKSDDDKGAALVAA